MVKKFITNPLVSRIFALRHLTNYLPQWITKHSKFLPGNPAMEVRGVATSNRRAILCSPPKHATPMGQSSSFTENESYKHKVAKLLLLNWLKAEEERTEHCNFCGFSWRRNYGVFSELKFYATSHPYYFEAGSNSGAISFVPDITIFHKGVAMILIEIVHRSPLTNDKKFKILEFFGNEYFELYTIEADHILNNTGVPTFLTYKKVL